MGNFTLFLVLVPMPKIVIWNHKNNNILDLRKLHYISYPYKYHLHFFALVYPFFSLIHSKVESKSFQHIFKVFLLLFSFINFCFLSKNSILFAHFIDISCLCVCLCVIVKRAKKDFFLSTQHFLAKANAG